MADVEMLLGRRGTPRRHRAEDHEDDEVGAEEEQVAEDHHPHGDIAGQMAERRLGGAGVGGGEVSPSCSVC